jgi:hypothetical protein
MVIIPILIGHTLSVTNVIEQGPSPEACTHSAGQAISHPILFIGSEALTAVVMKGTIF